jgi:hypothetical protein
VNDATEYSEWLTPKQAAGLLPFGNADWIRAQLRRGTLRGAKVAGRWLVTKVAIADMVNAGSNETRRRRRRRIR